MRDYIYIGRSRIAMVLSKKCLADIDHDNDVDGNDLATLASDFNRSDCSSASPCPGDINGDGVVDLDDLGILACDFGKTDCPHDEYYYFYNDHLGTPQKITDQSGTIVWSANYRPFGEASITTDTITNPFRFPRQYLDPETGLHYNYFRYYDPKISRFNTPDPSNTNTELKPYLFVMNNALRWRDRLVLDDDSTYKYMKDLAYHWFGLFLLASGPMSVATNIEDTT